MSTPKHAPRHADILILGAGIGGYETYRHLAAEFRRQGIKKIITLVDRHNYFTFTPLLHEVATGSVLETHATVPIRELIHHTPHRFIRAHVTKINPTKKIVTTSHGDITFDSCVIALGSNVNHFNVPGADEHTHHVRSLTDAIKLRQAIVGALEGDAPDINMVVVGGGATGVEVAGQLMHMHKKEVRALYPEKKFHISLVQNLPNLLSGLHPSLQQQANRVLTRGGVELCLNRTVKKIEKDRVVLDVGSLPSTITIWTAGFANVGIHYLAAEFCGPTGRILVDNTLQLHGHPGVYAIGDIVYACDPKTNQPYPQLGEFANRAGHYAATHILNSYRKKSTRIFSFSSQGTLIPIGEWYGLGRIAGITFSGRLAWWLRRTVYLLSIPGFNHKLRIASDWTLHGFDFHHLIDLKQK